MSVGYGSGAGSTTKTEPAPKPLLPFGWRPPGGLGRCLLAIVLDLDLGTASGIPHGLGSLVGAIWGAALLTLIFHDLEAATLAHGAAPADGFMPAFRGTFRLAGVVSALAAVMVAASLARHRRP